MTSIKRIAIFGTPGSGKTTLGIMLKDHLNIPCYHMDQIIWKENWILREKEECRNLLHQWIRNDTWIIEGAGLSTLEIRYANSDMFIHLAPPRWLCILRVFKRAWFRGTDAGDKPKGCREKVNLPFLKYLWNFEKIAASGIAKFREKYPEIQYVSVKNQDDFDSILQTLREKNL